MRIIHAADFHLDSPFDALTPEQAVERRAEQRRILDRLVDLAHSTRAEVVLLPGDLLDGDRVYQETIEALSRALGQMQIPVFIAPGNHDYYTHRSPYAVHMWPDNVHIFRSGQMESVELPELNAVVYGAAFTSDGRGDSLLRGFTAPEDGRLHLMVLHADVDSQQGSRYCPVAAEDIAASNLDYLALGHIHTCSGVQYADGVPWAYSGCPEGRGFDELGVKGVLCGEVQCGGKADLTFVPLCQRQYHIYDLTVTAEDTVETIAAQALSHAAPKDLVRFVLNGESGPDGVDLTALQERCAGFFYSVVFRDKTRVSRDLWSRAGEENLTGLFLRCMQARLDGADEEQASLLQKATRFGLAALENREDIAL